MFGSEALEVGIGLIFIYLVLSLAVTASTEVIAALFRLRARVLRNSIINFLTDGPAGAFKRLVRTFNPFGRDDKTSFVNRLYDHPLLQTLQASKHGPSYVPARTFALALMDVLDNEPPKSDAGDTVELDAAVKPPSGLGQSLRRQRSRLARSVNDYAQADAATTASVPPLPAWTGRVEPQVREFLEKLKDKPLLYNGLRTLINEAVMDLELAETGQGTASTLELAALEARIREAATGALDTEVKSALLKAEALEKQLREIAQQNVVEPLQVNMAMLREKIEVWFNTAMDQVSGWYKRWAKFISFVVALTIVFPLNADTIMLADVLSQDDDLRQALVAQATTYAEANRERFADQGEADAEPAAAAQAAASDSAAVIAALERDLAAARQRQAEIDSTLQALQEAGLPLGWQGDDYGCWRRALFGDADASETAPAITSQSGALTACSPEATDRPWLKLVGLLITALALTLGAPFWFDLLNKAINIRADASSPREVPRAPEAYPKREENIPPQ